MKLTEQEVKKIAELAKLDVPGDKPDYYAEELSIVLNYVEQLNELETEDAEPMAQATELYSSYREDIQRPGSEKLRANIVKTLMKAVPFKEKGFAKVRSVFTGGDK